MRGLAVRAASPAWKQSVCPFIASLRAGGTSGSNFTKTGNGSLTLAGGNNSFNGDASVAAGSLLVNGVISTNNSRSIRVSSGATIGGNGTIGRNVLVNGTLAPGNSPSTLEITGNLSLADNSAFVLELNGGAPGDAGGAYDQVNVTGGSSTVTLGSNVTLSLSLGFAAASSDVFYVLTRADAGTYGGTFTGLAEGASIDFGNGTFGTLTYTANWTGTQAGSSIIGGNDIAIYNLVPEPSVGLMILGGFGLLGFFRRRV